MTEAQRQSGTDPIPMLMWLRDTANERELRVFAASCCRLWEGIKDDHRATAALNAVQRWIDGQSVVDELQAANKDAWRSFYLDLPENAALNGCGDASHADLAITLTDKDAWTSAYGVSWIIRCQMRGTVAGQSVLLRDIFGERLNAVPG
jgi:hypothetical protein